jgi:hypothetical protein
MIILFIHKYSSIEESIIHYVQTKKWKFGQMIKNIETDKYFEHKMEKLLAFFPEKDREVAKQIYLLSIVNLTVPKPLDQSCLDVNKLEYELGQKLKSCYVDLIHISTDIEDGFRKDIWSDNNNFVTSKWKFTIKSGIPSVEIDSLIAKQKQPNGRATRFLFTIVRFLQSLKNPYSTITMSAWTGYNTYYGLANGAYIWGRLGVEYEDSKQYRESRAIDIDTQKYKIVQRNFKNYLIHPYTKDDLDGFLKNNHFEFNDLDDVIKDCIELITNLHHPWEFANLEIRGYPLGKFLMSRCEKATYQGIMYPNQPHSPGMLQFSKWIKQLEQKHNSPSLIEYNE